MQDKKVVKSNQHEFTKVLCLPIPVAFYDEMTDLENVGRVAYVVYLNLVFCKHN